MPATAADWLDVALRALGAVAGGLVTLAAAVYGVQRTLKRDRRDDTDATLLGRGKATIFEQYEGVIARLEIESKRQQERIERLLDDQTVMREMMSRASARILEIERELETRKKIVREMAGDIISLKRQRITLDDLQDTGIYETRFRDTH